jgi:hypothetical protein
MFNELYYSLYEVLKKVKTNDNPGFNAYLGISSFQCFNIITLGGIANYFIKLDISKSSGVYFSIFLYVLVTAVNYFTLLRKKDKIIKKFEKLPIERQRKGKLYFWLYALITLALLMIIVIFLVKPKY